MTNKLYVANVPVDASEDALRRHFAACGGVCDVELMTEPRSGKGRGLACVTMTSPAYASAALARLDGVDFEGRALRVSDAPIRPGKPPAPKVKVVQQFRERINTTYELDCDGVPLTVRVFPIERDRWRVEARSSEAGDAVVISGLGATRLEALGEVVRAWNESAATSRAVALDGAGLSTALRDVKAV